MFFDPLSQFDIVAIRFPVYFTWKITTIGFSLIFLIIIFHFLKFFYLEKIEFLNINNKNLKMSFVVNDFFSNQINNISSIFFNEKRIFADNEWKHNIQYIFLYILLSNFIGLLPFNETVTSMIQFPLFISFTVFVGINVIGFIKYTNRFWNMFVPLEAPAEIRMALVLIEVISHIMKCFSLSIRLFANIFSGHVLLYIIGSSVFLVLLQPEMFVIGFSLILPFFSVIIFMELFVAFLQAYVFSTLSSMYFKEILASK